MQLRCRSCDAPIPAANMNLEHMTAKCDACQAVFNFADDLKHASPARHRAAVAQPKGFTIQEDPHCFTLTRRWFGPAVFGLLFFCIFWDGFLVVWYSATLAGLTQNSSSGLEWGAVLFPLGHVAVGVGLTYVVIAGFLNTTKISVNESTLAIKHGPLPWPGNKELPTLDITQVFCKEGMAQKNKRSTYQVKLVMKDSKKIKLLSGLVDMNHALFIEQKIENILGLQDKPVAGELPR